jgi:hypothetical protein
MAIFTLEDIELRNLISNIIQLGKSKEIENWLEQIPQADIPPSLLHHYPTNYPLSKRLGYKDYKLAFPRWEVDSGSVRKAALQVWRPSRFFGYIENRRVFSLLEEVILTTYKSLGFDLSGMYLRRHSNGFGLAHYSGVSTAVFDIKLDYEPKSEGQIDRRVGPFNDFIIFHFCRYLPEASTIT